jgi:hypothetical protein
MVRPLVYNGVKSLELKSDAEERYNRALRARLGNTVWSACDSCASSVRLEKCAC